MQQIQLFQDEAIEQLPMQEADVWYAPNFFPTDEANYFLQTLQENVEWEQKKIKMFGKELNQPRLTAFYGDDALPYTYSGLTWQAKPWTKDILNIKQKVETVCDVQFTSVLLNLYRDGADSMGWHSDDESELGENPVIASVSFGAERKFSFRHRKDKSLKQDIALKHGSLLLMQGKTQTCWHHQLPKTKRIQKPRINLTFRIVYPQ